MMYYYEFHIFRVVVLESHLSHEVTRRNTLMEDAGADLYILAGHEASY